MKADQNIVYNGAIYLTGAEMPEGWVPPVRKPRNHGVKMFGPGGQLTDLPGVPLPENVTLAGEGLPVAGIRLEDRAYEDLVRMAKEQGLPTDKKKKSELIKELAASKTE